MIYLFDRAKKLQKIIPRKHIINATQNKVRNGIYQLAVEVPIFYETKQGTHYNYQKSVSKAEFAGHYDDKNRFQLYKIYSRNITANEQGEFLLFDGVHIFFDEAKAMGNIHDRRFRDSEAKAPADAAFNSIGWTVIDYDVTDRHDINFYRAGVTDAWNDLISTYGVEFDYELQFDGRKIISKNIIMKKQIGKWTGQRFAYGTNVLTLTQEQDESEVYTAAVGRGRGEESGDGFGPRLEFGDIAWSNDGITKPVGQNYIELPSATAEYGFIENGVVKPRIAPEVVFENIEDKIKLADATYYWLLENCLPKATWKTEVARIGNLNLGDTVGVLYKAAGIIKRARVEKIEYNLLDPELSKLTLGDFHHFENRQMKRINAQIKRLGRDTNDRITRIKNEWNAWIDNQFTAALNEFEQNYIDQKAQIAADLENMTNHIEDTRTEFTDNLNAEITQTKEYAEQQAQEKAEIVRTDLESVTSGHQVMLDSLQNNVMNIDDFLGDKTVGLNELLYNERMLFEERINSINTWHYNLLKETQTLDDEFWEASNGEIVRSSPVSYFRKTGTANISTLRSKQEMFFEAGETYTLTFEVQTFGHRRMDYVWILNRDTNVATGNYNLVARADDQNAQVIYFGSNFRRYFITFTMAYDFYGVIQIGGNVANNEIGVSEYQIRKPYLTQSDNRNWLYHPDDNTQSIEEITRRITQLEDGREEFITRTQYDFETGEIEGSIKNIIETVDESTLIMQNHENWILTNGASIERTVDGFDSKAWLSDIHNPNMIPHSRFVIAKNIDEWENWNAPLLTKYGDEWLRVRNMNTGNNIGAISPKIPDKITAGETYTVTWEAFFNLSETRISSAFDYMYIVYSNNDNQGIGKPIISETKNVTVEGNVRLVNTYELTFTARHSDNNASILFGTTAQTGLDNWFFMRYPKLEVGTVSTPYFNAFSNLSQRADEMMLAIQGIDMSGLLSQSDIQIIPDYVQLGSQRLDGSNIGSLLRVSPTGIDMVAEAMRLSGDLYVDGDITALAVDAIEGNFARLFASQLAADVITSDHIQVGTQLVDKLFATSARIDELITKTHFVNEMHALTLNVVDLNASQIRTRLLSANTIEASWIKSGTALLDRVFSSTAMFERMMAKSGFITTLNTVTIDTDQLTIRRPDGVAWVSNGVYKFNLEIQRNTFMDPNVSFNGQNYSVPDQYWRTFENAYTYHNGRYLTAAFAVTLASWSVYNSAYIHVRVREFGSGSLMGSFKVLAPRTGSNFHNIELDLGKPDFNTPRNFYLEARMDDDRSDVGGYVRVNRLIIRG